MTLDPILPSNASPPSPPVLNLVYFPYTGKECVIGGTLLVGIILEGALMIGIGIGDEEKEEEEKMGFGNRELNLMKRWVGGGYFSVGITIQIPLPPPPTVQSIPPMNITLSKRSCQLICATCIPLYKQYYLHTYLL